MITSANSEPRQILKILFMRESIPNLDSYHFATESEPGKTIRPSAYLDIL